MLELQNGIQGLRLSTARGPTSGRSPPLASPVDWCEASTPRQMYPPDTNGNLNAFADQLIDVASLYGVSDKMEYDARLHRSAAGKKMRYLVCVYLCQPTYHLCSFVRGNFHVEWTSSDSPLYRPDLLSKSFFGWCSLGHYRRYVDAF